MASQWETDLHTIFQKSGKKILVLPTQSLLWHEYQELVDMPGVMDVQLVIAGAPKEDIAHYPAKTSRQDSTRFFPWIKAGHSFKGTIMSQRLVKQNDSDDYYTVTVNFDCSQKTLDTLVKAIYERKIELTADNVKDILTLADFLQAEWLTKTVLQHIKAETLEGKPISVFRIGQRFHSAELTDDAIASVAKRGRKDIEELLCQSTDDSLRDERNLLVSCAEKIPLADILSAMIKQSSAGGWKVTAARGKLLAEKYPAAATILQHLVSAEDPEKAAELYHMQRLQLAALLLPASQDAARYQKSARMEFSIDSPRLLQRPQWNESIKIQPCEIVTQNGRAFRVSMEGSAESRWHIAIFPCGTSMWRKTDEITVRTLSGRPLVYRELLKVRTYLIGTCDDLCLPEGPAQWIKNMDFWRNHSKLRIAVEIYNAD